MKTYLEIRHSKIRPFRWYSYDYKGRMKYVSGSFMTRESAEKWMDKWVNDGAVF